MIDVMAPHGRRARDAKEEPNKRGRKMAEPTDSGNSNIAKPPAGAAAPQAQVRVVGQYIKDLSFENPNVGKLLDGPGEQPALRVEVNVNATKVRDKVFESAIAFKAQANSKAGVIYDLELSYAGLFEVQNLPDQALEPFLLINCPALLFPFLRRLVADLTREGGFPPLLLDPIDFAALFMQKKQQQAGGPQPPATVN
jgi:preprotein translocase subunit SecB